MTDAEILTRATINSKAKKLADMAELEMVRARNAEAEAATGRANFQVVKLGERDRHTARAGAFIEAAKLVIEENRPN